MTVKATRCHEVAPGSGVYAPFDAPGQFYFRGPDGRHGAPGPGEEGQFVFACPRTGGYCGSIRIGNGFKPAGDRTWLWDGNLDAPTLQPSINCLSHGPNGEEYAGCGWHAYVTNGEFGDG